MYFVELHGQEVSFWPDARGAPTECTQGTNSPSSRRASSTGFPMRVMVRILTTTYGLSVISTPICAMGLPIGPIEKGTTYIVRPFMQPLNTPWSFLRIDAGSSQLFVGPASVFTAEQMKVRSSTRATSEGSEQAR